MRFVCIPKCGDASDCKLSWFTPICFCPCPPGATTTPPEPETTAGTRESAKAGS